MEMQDMLADRLKQKRALSHASLEEYSKELGISKSALQKYEAGTGNPTLATVQTIADHLLTRARPSCWGCTAKKRWRLRA